MLPTCKEEIIAINYKQFILEGYNQLISYPLQEKNISKDLSLTKSKYPLKVISVLYSHVVLIRATIAYMKHHD